MLPPTEFVPARGDKLGNPNRMVLLQENPALSVIPQLYGTITPSNISALGFQR